MNLLLVSREVPDFQVFVDSVNPNTRAIVYSPSMTQQELLEQIQLTSVERLAIVSIKDNRFINQTRVTESDDVFQSLIQSLGIKTIDFLACNTLMDPRWTQFYTRLEASGVVVGASNDRTGNLKYGGDWTMESTGEDIERIYFTNSIQYYNYLLDDRGNTLFFFKDKQFYGLGSNSGGKMGYDYSYEKFNIPAPILFEDIPSGTRVTSVACGYSHSVALLSNGSLWGSGSNYDGRLGFTSDVNNVNGFEKLIGLPEKVVSFACGSYETFALLSNGELWGTGENYDGQLGLPNENNYGFQRIEFQGQTAGTTVSSIACGAYHSMALMSNGELWGTGEADRGELGYFGDNTYCFKKSTEIPGTTFTSVACGKSFTLAISSNGELWGTGNNVYGKLGLDSVRSVIYGFERIPLTGQPPGTTVTSVACGRDHSVILLSNGELWGAGKNNYTIRRGWGGNIIDHLGTFLGFPINIPELYGFKPLTGLPGKVLSVICDEYSTVALLSNGELWGTGSNEEGGLGQPDTIPGLFSFTKITDNVSNIVFPISNICFLANTPIITDQGIFPIDQLDPEVHTIQEKKIVAITKTVSQEKYLICIEKDALGPNMPSQDTVITQNHKLLYQGAMTQAKHLKQVHKVAYHGEVLYNVLMETHQIMNVNNLICETLDPDNGIAKLERILKGVTSDQKEEIIQGYNRYVLQENIFTKEIF